MFKRLFKDHVVFTSLLLAAAGIWFFMFRSYLAGHPAMTRHGIDYYLIIKYFMENLSRGVLPLWDPAPFWGRPDDIDQRFIGEINPFLWLYPLFTKCVAFRPTAYLLYSFIYYQVGIAGFYFLANRFFGDRRLALVSAALLMFSSLSFPIFNNYCITLLIVPVIWFFYYLLAFGQEPRRHFFLGLIFATALIATTYMPFYFLTLIQPFILGMLILFYRETKEFLLTSIKFLRENKMFVILCLIFLGIAFAPGVQWYLDSAKGDMVLSWRHANAGDSHTASMNLVTIEASAVSNFMTLKGLFANLAQVRLPVFFLSIFIFPVLLLSVINKINRRQILLLLMVGWLFLILLADVTPVHRFLYEHVYFYRLFRNLVYFAYFGLPIVVLFCVEQLRLLLEPAVVSRRGKFARVVFVWIVHALFAFYLFHLGGILVTSYITIAMSAVFFTLYFAGILTAKKNLTAIFLLALVLTQPVEFFANYVRNSWDVVAWFPTDRFVPKFSYARPAYDADTYYKGISPKEVQDASGYAPWKYTGLRWCFDVHNSMNRNVLEPYTRHKFVVYDSVAAWDKDQVDFLQLESAFAKQTNQALVFPAAGEKLLVSKSSSIHPLFIEGPTDRLKVVKFDLNDIRIKTKFDSPKFLVYNDSFHPGWQASVNAKPTRIYQSNSAFKGVWLPAGENTVDFHFGTPLRHILYFLLLGVFYFVFGYLIWLTIQVSRKQNATKAGA